MKKFSHNFLSALAAGLLSIGVSLPAKALSVEEMNICYEIYLGLGSLFSGVDSVLSQEEIYNDRIGTKGAIFLETGSSQIRESLEKARFFFNIDIFNRIEEELITSKYESILYDTLVRRTGFEGVLYQENYETFVGAHTPLQQAQYNIYEICRSEYIR